MPIRRGPASYSGYNDPNMAKAVTGIASMFAPPDSSDIANMATAQATREKAARLAELYTNREGYSRDQLDRSLLATGLATPNQSFYAVDQGNATTMATTAANNQRALQERAMQESGMNTRQLMTPQAQNTVAFIPPAVARANGVDAGPRQGMLSLNPGEKMIGPGGVEYQGNEKPRTKEEILGQNVADVIGANPSLKLPLAMGTTPTMNVVDQGTVKPVYTADAIKGGMTPDQDVKDAKTAVAINAQGDILGPASLEGGRWVHTQSKTPYGPDAVGFPTVSVQAPTPGGLGRVKTNEQQEGAAYAYRMSERAVADLDAAYAKPNGGGLPDRMDEVLRGAADSLPPMARGMVRNQMSPAGQIFLQNIRTALPMQLLTQSGLGVTESEYGRKTEELVPVRGEDPQVTKAKRDQLNAYIAAVRAKAGPALTNKSPTAAEVTAAANPNAPPVATSATGSPSTEPAQEEHYTRVNGKLVRVR